MHPPYTEEKQFAAREAAKGSSVLTISDLLIRKFGMFIYEADTIARYAVEDYEENG